MHHSPDMALLFTLGSSFIIMLVGIACCCCYRRRCRREYVERIKALRIDKMLDHIGITRSRYLHKTSPLMLEKHLLVCEHCKTTDTCDECLKHGKNITEHTFCRNYNELIQCQRVKDRSHAATK